jgi:hypothetical protein
MVIDDNVIILLSNVATVVAMAVVVTSLSERCEPEHSGQDCGRDDD